MGIDAISISGGIKAYSNRIDELVPQIWFSLFICIYNLYDQYHQPSQKEYQFAQKYSVFLS